MSSQLSPVGALLALTWEQYKERAIPLLAVVLISSAVIFGLILIVALCAMFGGILLAHVENTQTVASIVIILVSVILLIITILGLWFQAALLAIVTRKDLGIIETFQAGWEYLWPMTWVLTIYSGIMVTGFIAGILPALLCIGWFSFCFYILIEEDRLGMDTLLASMEYVRGNWWNTFGKLLLIWFLYMAIGIIPFVGTFLSIIFYPFLMLFILNMYHDLKESKGEAEISAGAGTRIFWWVVAAIGLVLPVIALAGGLLALIAGDGSWSAYFRQVNHGISI